MNIVVLATASRQAGALTIYKQFLNHLQNVRKGDNYYIFLHPSMPQPEMPSVNYIVIDTSSFLNRIRFDFYGCKIELKRREIQEDVIISLQNTGIFRAPVPQIIYYHQPLPLYPNKWNPFKKTELPMFCYKHIYSLFVRLTCNSLTQYVAQIPFIKEGICRKWNVEPERVHVLFPDIERVDVEKVTPYEWGDDCMHFVYPANMAKYKNYDILVNALSMVQDKKSYKLHLTLTKEEYPELYKRIKVLGLENVVLLEGMMPHERILSMYKASKALLFPSTIETLGLPLLEAGAFGLPIIAADLDYAHQVMEGYEGIRYVDAYDAKAWAKAIEDLRFDKGNYPPITYRESTWPKFFELIRNYEI